MNPPGALPSWDPPIKCQYFHGTSGDFQALYDEIQRWLEEVKPSGYQLHSTSTFLTEEREWHILVTAMYQEAVSQDRIIIPTLSFPGRPVA